MKSAPSGKDAIRGIRPKKKKNNPRDPKGRAPLRQTQISHPGIAFPQRQPRLSISILQKRANGPQLCRLHPTSLHFGLQMVRNGGFGRGTRDADFGMVPTGQVTHRSAEIFLAAHQPNEVKAVLLGNHLISSNSRIFATGGPARCISFGWESAAGDGEL